jgi:hypothetical protein
MAFDSASSDFMLPERDELPYQLRSVPAGTDSVTDLPSQGSELRHAICVVLLDAAQERGFREQRGNRAAISDGPTQGCPLCFLWNLVRIIHRRFDCRC